MKRSDTVIVTEIFEPVTVYSEKGRHFEMVDRKHYGISFCESGKIIYTQNGKTIVSDKSVAVILPKGDKYSLYGEERGYFPLIDFEADGLHLDEIEIKELFDAEECISEYRRIKDMFFFGADRFSVFSAFYSLLSKVFCEKRKSGRLLLIEKYIRENLSDPGLSNTEIAKHAGISEVYLRKIFAEEYGMTPKQYVLERRMQTAKSLLSDGSRSVTEISELCGFSSQYHFSRAFKKRVGICPTVYAAKYEDRGL